MRIKTHFRTLIQEHGVFIAVIFIGIIIFACRYVFVVHRFNKTDVFKYEIGETVELRGEITAEPDRREGSTKLTVDTKETRLLLTVERYSNWQYGDKISFSGKLKKPENFSSDTGLEFDYVSYLAKDDIQYQMFFPKITLLSRENGNFIKEKLIKVKYALTHKLETAIPEPNSALLAGILLGSKHSLGKKLLEDFRKAGVIHIVVLSGYNIAIIAEFIMWSLGFLPKKVGLTFGVIGILLFVGMTGAGASTIRAATMTLIAVLGKALGRTYTASRALFIAAFLMLIYNPRILLHDPSFQLSFVATFGLIYVSPVVKEKLSLAKLIPEKFQLRELVISTLTTQIFLLPFLLYQTGMLSLVSLPVNLLTLAFIPFTMLMGFITGVLGFFWPILALPFAFVTHTLLSYIIFIAEFFANLPFSTFTTSAFPFWLMVVVYIFYFYYLWRFYKKLNPMLPP